MDKAQCEVDAGFEGDSKIVFLEAKIGKPENFHVRQLFYPFRQLHENSEIKKDIVPIFFTYSNEICSLYIYEFTDPTRFNSLTLMKHEKYLLVPNRFTLAELQGVINNTPTKKEPAVPLPQANDFGRVIDLLTVLGGIDLITQEEMTSRYAFVGRQAHYYSAAARYLGIVEETRNESGQVAYALTAWGKRLAKANPRARNLALAERILTFETFRKTLEQWLNTGCMPKNQDVEVWIQASTPRLKSKNTRERRAQTIRGWVKWIVELIESDD